MTNKKKGLVPIQIIGTQRSGSNLLRLILNQSKQISAHHPPHILTVFYPILHKYGDLNKDANFEKLINDVCRLIEVNPVKWGLIFNRKEVFNNCSNRSLTEVFRVVYEITAVKDSASFWCCKSMANVNYFKDIERNGIKPYYIHLIRDGRDVASSFKKTLVGEKHVYHLANKWKSDFIKAKEISNLVESERFLAINYESLISNPMRVLLELNEFLSLNLDESSLHYFDSSESKKTAAAGFMWSNLTMPIISNNTGKYISNLSKQEIEIFGRVAGDTLQENGYELVGAYSKNHFTHQEIQKFDNLNIQLKNEAKKSKHLRTDRECRIDRKKLLNELTTFNN